MKRRNLTRAAAMASKRDQAKARRDNDAAAGKPIAVTLTSDCTGSYSALLASCQLQQRAPLDLDAMEAAARERLQVHIHTSALIHSSQIALQSAAHQAAHAKRLAGIARESRYRNALHCWMTGARPALARLADDFFLNGSASGGVSSPKGLNASWLGNGLPTHWSNP